MTSSKDMQPFPYPFFPKVWFTNQFCAKPKWPPQTIDLSNKVVVITGGNTGLGLESARQFLSFRPRHLIITARSVQKGETAMAKLRDQYINTTIEVWLLDMCSYDSIRAFAKRLEMELSRLDIVVLNAGVQKVQFDTVPSTGHEETIQVNYFSTVLLSILLLPILKSKSPADSPGRLSIVNAALSLQAKLPVGDGSPYLKSFDDPERFSPQNQYPSSKALAHLFLYKLVDYVSADDVIVNLVDPGLVKGTEMSRNISGIIAVFVAGFKAVTARALDVGACTYLDASIVKGKESHGSFIMSWQITPFNNILYTPEGKLLVEKVWKETMDELAFADIQEILVFMGSNNASVIL
ncbi:hypothetical protein BP6252_02935 [Coleophoma cylindrospora]|uniref:Uncharacterized protein n=1 Tax=Coleophoma cylindrospora TaxID=1849047 RepID=A0A3D8S696_9HELO|nr:hypothetical protein BP6252_02935 [Coleophoma cylindrospora]